MKDIVQEFSLPRQVLRHPRERALTMPFMVDSIGIEPMSEITSL
jgi:hypothetical protein